MQFFSFLLIIFFVEIAVGIMVYFQASSYDQIIGESVKQTVQHNYQTNNTAAMQTFDLIQEGVSMSTLTVDTFNYPASNNKSWKDCSMF